MFSFIYHSCAAIPFSQADLTDLATKAAEKNRRHYITGFLQHRDGRFLQYLEGGEKEVLLLMDTIARDPRHTVIRSVVLPENKTRQFINWYMRIITQKEFIQLNLIDLLEKNLQNISTPAFDDEYLQGSIIRLVDRLAKHQQKQPFFN